MDILLPLAVIVGFVACAVIWKVRQTLRARELARDDTVRGGHSDIVDPDDAARRAHGRTAWTRFSDSAGI